MFIIYYNYKNIFLFQTQMHKHTHKTNNSKKQNTFHNVAEHTTVTPQLGGKNLTGTALKYKAK